ncbi:MAG: sigma 54-interacting transcriptional regulator [Gemmatimonadaceae bacterium]|nr:sigma 54-interacting transcriptional regulator [Gemmatimonadaceae bacterium]
MRRNVSLQHRVAMVKAAPHRPALAPPEADRARDVIARLSGVGWFEVDADRTIIAVSPQLERITGFTAADVIGKPCISLIRCRECLKGCGVFRHGHVDETPLTVYTRTGAELEVVRAGEVVRDAQGNVTGAIETLRLADTRSPEAHTLGVHEVMDGREQLETLLGSLGRWYVIADAGQRVMSASTALAAMLGVAPDALRGRPLALLLRDARDGAPDLLRQALDAGVRREGLAAELVARDGEGIPVSISLGPIAATTHCGSSGARTAIMIRPGSDLARADALPAFEGIVGRGPQMQRIFRLIELLHDNDATILVTGESGTGKEMVARALHARSGRRGPFVAVNCAALPAELLESELFGHVRGAFTGALRDRAGRFEAAEGGTLFLDEIGDMPPALQAKLLRVLQDHTFERVGESRTRTADVRVIAATHVDLAAAVAAGRFREDLFYRLRVVPIHVPPLRERRDDLTLLIPHLLERIGQRRGRALRLSPAALDALVSWDWPGNVRELENALEYATALCDGQTVQVTHLPPGIAVDTRAASPVALRLPAANGAMRGAGGVGVGEAGTPAGQEEMQRIRGALERARYRRDEAARALGMSRTTLWRKMKEYRL